MLGSSRRDVRTLCPYCGVGCGIIATTAEQRIVRVRGDPDHPANFGRLCQKGATVALTVHAPNRLHYPMLRQADGSLAIVSTETAVEQIARSIEQILQHHGPGAMGLYLSGQLSTESQYLAAKFARACLRTNHVDSNSRLCMASAASGMSLSLGSDGPPTCYADIELADAFMFVGSNAAECHPVLFDRVRDRLRSGHARCVVVDPRRTSTAEAADVHLAIRPGSDLALLNGLLRLARDAGRLDRSFIQSSTEGWDELNELLEHYPPQRVAELCGIRVDGLASAARILIEHERLITFWTMGVNQTMQGTATSNAIINLHLATGRIGKPGCGPFSLTGQPNAMGGRDCGYMSHALPGQRLIANAEHRAWIERFWGLPPGHIPPEPGYDAVRMFDALDRGELKGIWIIGTNPAASMPNLPRVRRALSEARLVIVQDAYHPTETTRFAHVILPAAVNFEQTGVFTNSERRVTLMEQVVPPPGQARPDWWWILSVARAMGFERGMRFTSSAEIFDEFARSTAGRPNDQSALHHELLRRKGPQHWPYPALGQPSPRRYVLGQFPTVSGKARFWAHDHRILAERSDEQYPLILTTGRLISHWHTRTKTGLVRQLNEQAGQSSLSMNPADAQSLGLCDGEAVRVISRRGHARTRLRLDATLPPGVVFMSIHFNDLFAPCASPNEATIDDTDPTSRQPALKYCAVRVEPEVATDPPMT
ncbi:molybdopterin oxidoreductase family protein [Fontivita pretiosa]|uniref:molybdopterin oxidoreductase family protein n=1 Tax=Fontivita pretiosa TaxID=2989684 RepID=UPI003D1700F9